MHTYTHTQTLRRLFDGTAISGPVVIARDPGWDAARQAWNLTVEQHPQAVVFPQSTADVEAAVAVARSSGLRVVTQGTGHGATAYGSLEDAVLIRTTRLQDLMIDGDRCRIGAGVLWGDVAAAAGRIGKAGLGGSSPDVGVVGYTLGGGIGWLSRRYGLASNRVLRIEMVTADGTVHDVDGSELPEVFWALRGGGGGLGAVTSLEFELVPVASAVGGTLAWEAALAPNLLTAWAAWTSDLDEGITSIIRFLNLPDAPGVPAPLAGRRMLTLGVAAVGDADAATRAIDEMRRVAPPVVDTIDVMPASALCRLHGDPEGPTPGLAHHTMLSGMDGAMVDRLIEVAGVDSGSKLISVEVRHLGGALGRVPENAGALSHIAAPYVLNAVGGAYTPEQAADSYAQLGYTVDAMAEWSAGQYLNFVERPAGDVFADDIKERLAAIKADIDPDGMFSLRSGLGRWS